MGLIDINVDSVEFVSNPKLDLFGRRVGGDEDGGSNRVANSARAIGQRASGSAKRAVEGRVGERSGGTYTSTDLLFFLAALAIGVWMYRRR